MKAGIKTMFGRGFWASKGILGFVRLGLFSIFILFVLISIIGSAVEHRDIGIVIEEVGYKLLNPLQEAHDISLEILKQDNINFFQSLFIYGSLYFNLYTIYIWFSAIMFLTNIVLGQTNSPLIIYFSGGFLFATILVLYSVLHLGETVMYPFEALKDVFSAIKYIFN